MKKKINEIRPFTDKSDIKTQPREARKVIKLILSNIGDNPELLTHKNAIWLIKNIKVLLQSLIDTKSVEESKYPIFENVGGNTFKLK